VKKKVRRKKTQSQGRQMTKGESNSGGKGVLGGKRKVQKKKLQKRGDPGASRARCGASDNGTSPRGWGREKRNPTENKRKQPEKIKKDAASSVKS